MKELYQEYDVKMQKTIEVVVSDFAGVRAGRANAAVLDKITVEYYGTETPIQQVASISTPDARTLVIQPWDGTLLKAVEKALLASELGINPQNDGNQAGEEVRRGGQGGHPQHPPGCHGEVQGHEEKVRAHRGRPEGAGGGHAEAHRQAL